MSGSVFKLALEFSLVNQASAALRQIDRNIREIAKSNQAVEASYNSMMRAGKYAIGMGLAARTVSKEIKVGVNAAADLQEAALGITSEIYRSSKGAAVLNKEMASLKKTAFEVQAWSPFDMTEVMQLQRTLLQAGASPLAVAAKGGATEAAAALATYGNMPAVEAGKAVVALGSPFGIKPDQYMKEADLIARAKSVTVASYEDIAEAAKYAAPSMSLLGKSQEEMFGMIALLSNRGMAGSIGGTALKDFFTEIASKKQNKDFIDAKGNLKSFVEIIDTFQQKVKGKGAADTLAIANKMFGMRGAPVAVALLGKGNDTLDNIIRRMREQLSLQEKIDISMGGFNKQWEALTGTAKSDLADLFQPALTPLTAVVAKANDLATALGNISQKNKNLGKSVSYGSLGIDAALIGGTLVAGGLAVKYGSRVFRGMGGWRGLMGTGVGVAEGKALEKVAGVTPVFVTNWPAGGGLGMDIRTLVNGKSVLTGAGGIAEGVAAESAATKAVGSVLKKAPGLFAGGGMAGELLGAAGSALGLAGAGFAGWNIGRMMGENKDKYGISLDDRISYLFAMLDPRISRKDAEGIIQPTINVHVDRDGRAKVEYEGSGVRNAKVSVNRGSFN